MKLLKGFWKNEHGERVFTRTWVQCSYITKDFYQISDCIKAANWNDVTKLIAQFINIEDGLDCINNSVIYLHFSVKNIKDAKLENALIHAKSLEPVKFLNDRFLRLPAGGGYKYNERLIFKDMIESDKTLSFPVMLYLFRQYFVKKTKENIWCELKYLHRF